MLIIELLLEADQINGADFNRPPYIPIAADGPVLYPQFKAAAVLPEA
jgi:hypothetical protein